MTASGRDLRYEAARRLRAAMLRVVGWGRVAGARLTGRRFACMALAGKSTYNITVNADLSVSCNCNDSYGRGRIGDLRSGSLREVLAGRRATAFRATLAQGVLPIPECATCPELTTLPASAVPHPEAPVTDPRGVQLETIGGCNLSCIGCERRERPLLRQKMPLEALQHIAAELADMRIGEVSLYSLNEPFLSRNILDEIRAIRAALPDARLGTSTNGVPVDSDDKRTAALLLDDIVFSIDGCDQVSAERYQAGIDFAAAYANMAALVAARDTVRAPTRIVWKYVLFRWNHRPDQIARALDLGRAAGVDRMVFVSTMTPLYGFAWNYFLHPLWRRIGTRVGRWHWVDPRAPERPTGPPLVQRVGRQLSPSILAD